MGSGGLWKGQHTWNISVTKEARADPKVVLESSTECPSRGIFFSSIEKNHNGLADGFLDEFLHGLFLKGKQYKQIMDARHCVLRFDWYDVADDLDDEQSEILYSVLPMLCGLPKNFL